MYRYHAFGLQVQSDIRLPELAVDSAETPVEPQVHICLGAVDTSGYQLPTSGRAVFPVPGGYLMFWPKIGSFLVENGETVTINANHDTSEDLIRLPLLGMVLGALLHLRGLFTLHASSVGIGNRAVAFIGAKGAGKSTIAAALHARGHALLSDDVVAMDLRQADETPIRVIPGFPQMRIWPDSLDAVGTDPATLRRLHPTMEKRAYRSGAGFASDPVPLVRIYSLNKGPVVKLQKLSSREAMVQLLSHSYAARILGKDGAGVEHFRQCSRLISNVPAFRLDRTRDISQVHELSAYIENEMEYK